MCRSVPMQYGDTVHDDQPDTMTRVAQSPARHSGKVTQSALAIVLCPSEECHMMKIEAQARTPSQFAAGRLWVGSCWYLFMRGDVVGFDGSNCRERYVGNCPSAQH